MSELKDSVFLWCVRMGMGVSCLILLLIVGVIVVNGLPSMNLNFILMSSRNFGAEGGILYQIVGSLLIVGGAAAISFPLALGTAVYYSEFSNKWTKKLMGVLFQGLNGVPSIVFGIFGLIFFVNVLGMGISWLIGSFVLAFMILPTIIVSAYHAMTSIPTLYRESAKALGSSRWEVVKKVILPQSLSGGVTGLLIGLGRAIGETAPIMFVATAFSGVAVPSSFSEPVATLPTHILTLSQQATNPAALANAWGTTLVLVTLSSLFMVGGFISRLKLKSVSDR